MKNVDLEDVQPINTYAHSGTHWSRNPTCWRYMDLLSLISILENETIHFTHVSDLCKCDSQEGTGGLLTDVVSLPLRPSLMVVPPDPIVDEENRREIEEITKKLSVPLSSQIPEYREKVKQWDKENDTVYVNCWHTNDIESDFMWRIYGKYEYGFAIESCVEDLVYSFQNNDVHLSKIGFGFVLYPTRDRLVRENHEQHMGSFAAFMIKSPQYSSENEFRVFVKAKRRVVSCDMKVDLKRLVHGIRISPLTPRWAVDPLIKTLNPICRTKGLPLVSRRMDSLRDI